MKFLLDTNVISEIRHPNGDALVKSRFRNLNSEFVYTSSIVIGELTKGVRRLEPGKRKEQLLAWLMHLEQDFGDRILAFDLSAARIWGELVAAGLDRGRKFSVSDGQIAATAIANDLTVVTRNERDFQDTGARIWNIWERDSP